jgi:hypothetical protein
MAQAATGPGWSVGAGAKGQGIKGMTMTSLVARGEDSVPPIHHQPVTLSAVRGGLGTFNGVQKRVGTYFTDIFRITSK